MGIGKNKQTSFSSIRKSKQTRICSGKKSCTGFLYRKCTGNVPIVQIAVERKPLNFKRRSTYSDNIFKKLRGKTTVFKFENILQNFEGKKTTKYLKQKLDNISINHV